MLASAHRCPAIRMHQHGPLHCPRPARNPALHLVAWHHRPAFSAQLSHIYLKLACRGHCMQNAVDGSVMQAAVKLKCPHIVDTAHLTPHMSSHTSHLRCSPGRYDPCDLTYSSCALAPSSSSGGGWSVGNMMRRACMRHTHKQRAGSCGHACCPAQTTGMALCAAIQRAPKACPARAPFPHLNLVPADRTLKLTLLRPASGT